MRASAAVRTWLAETFRGLTWKRWWFFCVVLAFTAFHQPFVVYTFLRIPDLSEKLLALPRAFAQMLLIFTPVLLAVLAVENRGPRQGYPRLLALAAAIVLGHAVGALLWSGSIGLLFPAGNAPPSWRVTGLVEKVRVFGGKSMWFLVYSVTATAVYYFLKKDNAANAALHRARFRQEEMNREDAEARLQMMQAQIEPHFLFNTLASVRHLYRTDPASGRAMLDHLASYLTASLPSMRERRSTLERELALATAYLSVQKIRMESRLAYEVDVPHHLRTVVVPPMMIATLVENAVIHGLGPVPAGGCICISAASVGGELRIEVADNGKGIQDSWGGGVGLSNIRSRLASEFGDRARLTLQERPGGGVVAALTLPADTAEQAKAA